MRHNTVVPAYSVAPPPALYAGVVDEYGVGNAQVAALRASDLCGLSERHCTSRSIEVARYEDNRL